MKKRFTLILASMLLTMGVWAQIYVSEVSETKITSVELNAKTEATYIAIKNLSRTNNYYYVGNTGSAPYSKADFSNDAVFIWEPTGDGTTFYLKKLDGTYMQTSSPKDFGAIDNAAKFTTTNPTSTGSGSTKFNGDGDSQSYIDGNNDANLVRFVNASDKWINVQNGDSGTPVYNTGEGGWTIHYVYSVDVKEVAAVNVTYNYVLDGTVKKTVIVEQAVGSAYAAPAIDYVEFTYPDGEVTAETTTVDVICTQNLPFAVSTDYANATWYYMTIRSNNQKYIARSESAPYTNSKTITAGDNGLWAFKGNVFDGIQVINKGAGDGSTLGYAGTATGANVSMAEGETTWTIEEGNGGFILGQGENVYAHDYSSNLQIWNNTAAASDAGSAFNVFTAEELTNTQKTALQTLIDQASTYDAGTTIGYYTEASVANLATPLVNANTALSSNSLEEVLNATTALQAAINNLELILPEKGKFYRFKHPTADAYMLSDVYSGDAKYLAMGALESNKVSSIFYYGEDGTLLSYANGRYLSNAESTSTDWTCLAVGTKGNAATFGKGSAVGTVGFYLTSGRAYWSDHETYVDAGGSFGSNSGYDWVVEEVTYLPVAMNTTYGYATLCSPVALSTYQWNSTSAYRVKAYTGTLSDNVLTLDRIDEADGVIPANTPVVLEYVADIENGYVYLAVSNSDKEAIASDLIGTAAAVVNPNAGTEYTLQGHNGGVAFKQYIGDNLTGFKAYLVVESKTNAIRIRKGSEEGTTSIDNAQLTMDNENVVIYDLQGRRVEKMEKGIYIVNGKKVVR